MSDKKAAKKSETAAEPLEIETTKAGREKDKEEAPHVARVDLGEALPTRPIPTATDNE